MQDLQTLALAYADALVRYNECTMAYAAQGGTELMREQARAYNDMCDAHDALNRKAAQVAAAM